ncbi:MAG TPA: DMT family transporter [Pseudorhizobium sp.]|nr:DMT family transporter [Pseudorhizobium sp.]
MSADGVLVAGSRNAAASNVRASMLVLAAFAVFSGTDAIVKLLAIELPVAEVTFLVTAIAFLLLILGMVVRGTVKRLVPRQPRLALLRALLLAGDTLLIHYAFAMLPMSEAYLLAFLTPVIVAVLSAVLLQERLSSAGWLGVLLGFAGVAVALRPDVGSLNLGHAAAVGSALVFALSLILLRFAKAQESDEALVAALLLVLMPLSLSAAYLSGRLIEPTPFHLLLVCVGGLALLAGHALLVRAFRIGEASIVAPFQYSQIIWGCIYGLLLFAAPIETHTLVGAGIIILSGWLVLRKSAEKSCAH